MFPRAHGLHRKSHDSDLPKTRMPSAPLRKHFMLENVIASELWERLQQDKVQRNG